MDPDGTIHKTFERGTLGSVQYVSTKHCFPLLKLDYLPEIYRIYIVLQMMAKEAEICEC